MAEIALPSVSVWCCALCDNMAGLGVRVGGEYEIAVRTQAGDCQQAQSLTHGVSCRKLYEWPPADHRSRTAMAGWVCDCCAVCARARCFC